MDGLRASRELNTLVRITYDDEFIYVAAECIGLGTYIIQSLKRDIPFYIYWWGALPAQLYRFNYGQIKYVEDKRREIKLSTSYSYGSFYNGICQNFL